MDNEYTNPSQPSSFTCHVVGNPPPVESDVDLYRYTNGLADTTGITRRSSTLLTETERAVVFDVESVVEEEYLCTVTSGVYSANKTVDASLYGNAFFDFPLCTRI